MSEIEPITYIGQNRYFDGDTFVSYESEKVIYDNYDIELMIKQNGDTLPKNSGNNSYPPMIGYIDKFGIYRIGQRKIRIYNSSKIEGVITLKDYGWFKIRIKATKEKNRTVIYLNDNLICATNAYTNLSVNYQLGKGYFDRFWKGNISYLKILRYNKNHQKETIVNAEFTKFDL